MTAKLILKNGPFEYKQGYLHGRNFPTLKVRVKSENAYDDWPQLLNNLVKRTQQHIEFMGFSVDSDGISIDTTPLDSSSDWSVLSIPVLHCNTDIIYQCWRLALFTSEKSLDTAALKKLEPMKRNSPSPLMTNAANVLGLPLFIIANATAQYGLGRNSRWFNHTFSEQTSNLSARLARDKKLSIQRLRTAGLPTTKHYLVSSLNHALDAAKHLGYPVVAKPYNQDGGGGVTAAITDAKELTFAYEKATKFNKSVLIEKHVEGRDYRLTVFDGKLVWAVERRPAGVTGDGSSSIKQLIEKENQNPARMPGSAKQTLKPLQLNKDAELMLAKQQLKASDVPKKGQFVRLHSIANVATGGTPHVVTDMVHPDNAVLAERAAAALRLDLAGVDLIIPDISRSWRETGAAICEVNGQPDLGSTTARHLYTELLASRVPQQGRIPVVILVYAADAADADGAAAQAVEAAQQTAAELRKQYENVGCSLPTLPALKAADILSTRQNFINDTEIFHASNDFYHVAVMFLTDQTLDALVMCASADDVLQQGLPVQRVDTLKFYGAIAPAVRKALEPHIVST
ncbi:hypothetical protein [Pseudidiomarina atlantica]|uniref:ATP-binding protein n=1 Tax=Pseudidiomarina atlantica TaxID=1517416 RepID=UPI00068FC735|nr:hypothetical protein [Pseudidiomarina atlantica]